MTETVPGSEPAIADAPVINTEAPADAAPAVTDADESQDPKRKPGAEARISELTRLRRDAERERDYWHGLATRQNPAPQDTVKPEAPKKPPKLADFEFDEEKYQAALVAHVKDEAARELREELRQEEAQKTEQQRRDSFLKREREFAAKHPDYMDLTRDMHLPITKVVAKLVAETDSGPEILYYLANHRDEAVEISAMDDLAAARAIGRVESKLEKPAPPPPAPKPVSKAPPPPPQIEAVEPAVKKDPSEMTDAEFAKWRKNQIRQRR